MTWLLTEVVLQQWRVTCWRAGSSLSVKVAQLWTQRSELAAGSCFTHFPWVACEGILPILVGCVTRIWDSQRGAPHGCRAANSPPGPARVPEGGLFFLFCLKVKVVGNLLPHRRPAPRPCLQTRGSQRRRVWDLLSAFWAVWRLGSKTQWQETSAELGSRRPGSRLSQLGEWALTARSLCPSCLGQRGSGTEGFVFSLAPVAHLALEALPSPAGGARYTVMPRRVAVLCPVHAHSASTCFTDTLHLHLIWGPSLLVLGPNEERPAIAPGPS